MKFLVSLALVATFVSAIPIDPVASKDAHLLVARAGTSYSGGDTSDDLDDGSSSDCLKVIFIYARASTESGNMVNTPFDLT